MPLGKTPRCKPLGDSALTVELGETIDPAINTRVHALARLIETAPLGGVRESVPAYCSLLVHYDPLALNYGEVAAWIGGKLAEIDSLPAAPPRRIEIPTLYGGPSGPDIEFVAQHNHLSVEDVIRIHSSVQYRVYMMGFTPGFAYLGTLPEEIAAPRLESPRPLVRAGSVGIAGRQTGVYPVDSPGGWRIIGHTALRLFDLDRDPPFLLAPGDVVRFVVVRSVE